MIYRCINCSGTKFKKIINLKKVPLTDEFKLHKKDNNYINDVKISQCIKCDLIQNQNNLPKFYKYKNYRFSLDSSRFVKNFMSKFALSAIKLSGVKRPKVLEIGSGDGEQLKYFKKLGSKVVGIEPSEPLVNISREKSIPTIKSLFNQKAVNHLKKENFYPDIIVLQFTFDHLMDPNLFLKQIKQLMLPSSILLIEVHDFNLINRRNEICLLEHEHKIYLNDKIGQKYFLSNNFEVIKINPIHPKYVRANSLIFVLKNYETKINISVKSKFPKLDKFIYNNRRKKIIGYGAGGRGVISLALIKHHRYVSYIIDSNKSLNSLYAPKTNIQIKSPDFLKEYKPEIIIVFSFGYFDEIKNSLLKYIPNKCKVVSFKSLIN